MTTALGAPTLEADRLTLRPPIDGDAVRIALFCADYDVAKNMPHLPHPYPSDGAETFLKEVRRRCAVDRVWAIAGRVSETAYRPECSGDLAHDPPGDLVGLISIRAIDTEPVFGVWIGRPYWRRGYAAEAMRAVCSWAFERYGLPRIYSGAVFDNTASLRLHTRLGFVVTGRSTVDSIARKGPVAHVDLRLDAADYQRYRGDNRHIDPHAASGGAAR